MERMGRHMVEALWRDSNEVRRVGKQTLFKRCYNCGERMHVLERYKVMPGGKGHKMMNFWTCQKCGEVERPEPPPSAYGY